MTTRNEIVDTTTTMDESTKPIGGGADRNKTADPKIKKKKKMLDFSKIQQPSEYQQRHHMHLPSLKRNRPASNNDETIHHPHPAGGGGRQLQMDALLELYRRASIDCHPSATVLIASSGTGKTAFLLSFIDQIIHYDNDATVAATTDTTNTETTVGTGDDDNSAVAKQHDCPLIGFGKFEEQAAASEPYQAIVDVMDDVLDKLFVHHDDDDDGDDADSPNYIINVDREEWQARLKQRLEDDEIEILKNHLPSLIKLFSSSSSSSSSPENCDGEQVIRTERPVKVEKDVAKANNKKKNISDDDEEEEESNAFGDMSEQEYRFERFRLAFRELIRSISSVRTIVMVLDDLHFADRDSVALIKTIVDDTAKNKDLKLLFVGASRPMGDDIIMSTTGLMNRISGNGQDTTTKEGFDDRDHSTTSCTAPVLETSVPIKSLLTTVTLGTTSTATSQELSRFEPAGLQEMVLPGLNVYDIVPILKVLFDMTSSVEDAELASLTNFAHVVLDKTTGNAFLIMHFLRHLEKLGLVYYDSDSAKWKWDLYRIKEDIHSPQSVGDSIIENLKALDERQKHVLITAASFGVSHFELSTIVHAMDVVSDVMKNRACIDEEISGFDDQEEYTDHFTVSKSITTTRKDLLGAIHQGFIEEVSDGHFKFSHDRIREAAYTLLPKGKARKQVHLKIARQLRLWMDTEEEYGTHLSSDSMLLHAAKQYNYGGDLINDPWERLDVAELNFHAAEVAARKASFATAMDYLQNGIAILGPTAWTSHYDFTLKLTRAYSRMQLSCGDFDACIASVDEAIANGRTWEDKRDMYNTKMLCLMQQKRIDDSMELGKSIMEMLGYPFPRRFLTIRMVLDFMKGSKFLSASTDDEILNLHSFNDQNYVDALSVLCRMMECTFFGAPEIYFDVYAARIMATLKERGSHPSISSYAVVIYAMSLTMEAKFDEAERFGRLALQLSKAQCQGKYRGIGARIVVIYHYYIAAWRAPLAKSLRPISDSLTEMCSVGSLEHYHQDCGAILRQGFASGMPLGTLSQSCHKVLESLSDYCQPLFWNTNAPIAQAVLNLMGQSPDPTILAGDYVDSNVDVERLENSNNSVFSQHRFFSMILKYHFGDFKGAAQAQKRMQAALWSLGPEFLVTFRIFYTSLINIQLYRQSKNRKYKNRAKKASKQITRWVDKNGATNCVYQKLLLDAEFAAIDCNLRNEDSWREVLSLYKKSIHAASESGVRHHEALANELACDFLIKHSSTRDAQEYFLRALDLYGQWEANAKVDEMRRRYPDLVPFPEGQSLSR